MRRREYWNRKKRKPRRPLWPQIKEGLRKNFIIMILLILAYWVVITVYPKYEAGEITPIQEYG